MTVIAILVYLRWGLFYEMQFNEIFFLTLSDKLYIHSTVTFKTFMNDKNFSVSLRFDYV